MSKLLPGIIALVTIVGSGLVHGLQTDRWGSNTDLEVAAEQLKQVPKVIGDWTSVDSELPPAQLEMAGAVGYINRAYTNTVSGEVVNVIVLCGRHGPMAVHPPTICFTGAGWRLTENVKKRELAPESGKAASSFWQGDFARDNGGLISRIRTLWSWGVAGDWIASDQPRREFAGQHHLYKLYVTQNTSTKANDDEDAGPDALDKFLKDFLPPLKEVLQKDKQVVAAR